MLSPGQNTLFILHCDFAGSVRPVAGPLQFLQECLLKRLQGLLQKHAKAPEQRLFLLIQQVPSQNYCTTNIGVSKELQRCIVKVPHNPFSVGGFSVTSGKTLVRNCCYAVV